MKLIYGAGTKNNEVNVLHIDRKDLPIHSEIEAQKKTNLLLNEIETKKINGKTIVEMMKFNDFSLWWFVKPTVFQTMKESIEFIESFDKIIENKHPDSIFVKNDLTKLELIKQICKKNHIPLEYSFLEMRFTNIKSAFIQFIQSYRFTHITNNKIKTRMKLFLRKRSSIPDIKNKILFAIPSSYRRKIFHTEKGITNGEFIVGPLIDVIKKMDKTLIGVDLDYTFRGQPNILLDRLNDKIEWFPIEMMIPNGELSLKSRSAIVNYDKILKDKKFQKLFEFEGISLWNIIYNEFKKLLLAPYLKFYLNLTEGTYNYLQNNTPKIIFLPYEVGPLAQSIIISCNRLNVKTVGIQHGIIYGENPDYSHHNFRTKENQSGMPIPDYMLVFGNFSKRMLIEKQAYPPEKLIVFGHPMYFEIDKIKKQLDSNKIKTSLDISSDKKIILFTTGRYQSIYKGYENQNYDEQILEKLLDTYVNDPKYHVIIKPHPLDIDLTLYKNLISQFKCTNFSIMQKDLFELLQISDVTVCYFSTILLDSIVFGKPAIEVIFDNEENKLSVDKNSPILSTSLKLLPKTISELISNPNLQNNIHEKMNSFAKDQFNIPPEDYAKTISYLIE